MPEEHLRIVKVGSRFTWEPGNANAGTEEEIEVIEIRVNEEGSVWVKSRGKTGDSWNEWSRFKEAVFGPFEY